jgi:hypothetical protein
VGSGVVLGKGEGEEGVGENDRNGDRGWMLGSEKGGKRESFLCIKMKHSDLGLCYFSISSVLLLLLLLYPSLLSSHWAMAVVTLLPPPQKKQFLIYNCGLLHSVHHILGA